MSVAGSVTRPQRSPATLRVPLVPRTSRPCPEVPLLAFYGNFLNFAQVRSWGIPSTSP